MISPHYLPVDFTFRDPSKMKKFHYQSLLEHWYTRQEDDSIEIVFTFRGYWDSSSESVIAVTDKHPALRKRPKSPTKKRRTAPGSIALKPKRGNAKVARKVNASRKRPGPPGIRKGDRHWRTGEDEDEVDEEGEDEDEDEDEDENEDEGEDEEDEEGEEDEDEDEEDEENADDEDDNRNNSRRQRVMPPKAPKALPFAAKRIVYRGAPVALKKNAGRLPAVADKSLPKSKAPPKKARADVQTYSENIGDQAPQTDEISAAVTKRPQPRPAYRGRQGDDTTPAAIKEKPARKPKPSDLGPRSEPPVTRSGGKRKADDAELQAIGESSTKKGKKKAT
jgi:hypothetical protein